MKSKSNIALWVLIWPALLLTACGGGSSADVAGGLIADTQKPVISAMTAQVVSGNTVTLAATATDDVGLTGYCFKTVDTAPPENDACFQASPQQTGVVLTSGVIYYAWAKDEAGNVSDSFKGPCSIAGYAASDLSNKSTVCMMTDMGEIVLALDAASAPVTVTNFLRYVNDGFYSDTTFHRIIPTFMIQGGGYTYSTANSYLLKTPAYLPIALEKTTATGLSNLRGTIAMARTNVADSATSQFFINVVDNTFLDAAAQQDGNGYAVFGTVISGLSVADQIKAVAVESGTAGTNQPVTPVLIQWSYQIH